MQLQQRVDLMVRLGQYLQQENNEELQAVKAKAERANGWFIQPFIDLSVKNICDYFLKDDVLKTWVKQYDIKDDVESKTVGIVMAGNIPLVGFHDLLCVFISGHKALMKPSSKDEVLIKHIVAKLKEWNSEITAFIAFADMLKNCDAYIATGSNNSSRYFEYYFGKYPSIIRKNRTSIAVLNGKESDEELDKLADDIALYFGLGCRNVTKIYVPEDYDFLPLLTALKRYQYFADLHKYKNNYDYQLALMIMNKKFYMTNEAFLFAENESNFAPVSQVNYEYYTDKNEVLTKLKADASVQCNVGEGGIAFGTAQKPCITDYADGTDTLAFLKSL